MAMKCDSCIHKQVCKDKPPESYPQFMIDIMTDKCEHYINNIDVQPVKHGRWINENFCTRCSACGNMTIYDKYSREVESDYCPNCGAKMDGDDTYDKPT